jgi:hypothetical protein
LQQLDPKFHTEVAALLRNGPEWSLERGLEEDFKRPMSCKIEACDAGEPVLVMGGLWIHPHYIRRFV